MKNLALIWVLLLFIPINSCTCNNGNDTSLKKGSIVSGKVIAIIDGDTYDILLQDNKTVRVRMEGIDAPERGMPYYQKSKKYLSDLCYGKHIKIKITGVDDYKRILAYSYLEDGRELSQEMIKAGLAWHYKKYNSDKTLSYLEKKARNQKKGLWSEKNPMPPWTNRRLHRQGISTKDSFNILEYNR